MNNPRQPAARRESKPTAYNEPSGGKQPATTTNLTIRTESEGKALLIIRNLKVLLHDTFLDNATLPREYDITIQDIAETATPDTWETLKGMYTLEGHKHYKQNESLVNLLATHDDPAIRLAVALNPSFAYHVTTSDEIPLISNLARLHEDGHAMIPKVHTFLGLTKSFPRRAARSTPSTRDAEPAPEPKRAYELTEQQQDIIRHEPTSALVVAAAAGSGKTSTLVEYAKAWPEHKFLYLAFNAAIKKEAEQVMPRNVTVMTTHGLAYRSLGIGRIARGNLKSNLYRDDISAAAERVSLENFMSSLMLRGITHTLKQFIASDDKTVELKHMLGFDWRTEDKEPPRNAITIAKQVIESLMAFQEGDRPFTHDMYLKAFASDYDQLDGQYSAVMVDEFQDTNPAMVGFLKKLKTPVIGVGDSYQAIYGFRGAINAMNEFDVPKKPLTRSWRFGENLAETANFILSQATNPPSYEIHGNPDRTTHLHNGTGTEGLILARTNAGLFEHLTNVTAPFYIEGGYQSFSKEIEHAIKLFAAEGDFIPGPLPYKTWGELLLASEDLDPTAMRLDALLDKHPPTELRDHLRYLSHLAADSPKAATLHLATGHKAKGLERSVATLLGDFGSLRKRADLKEWLVTKQLWTPETQTAFDQEIHLLYVAATRAKNHLYVADENLYFELTNLRLAPPEKKPERQH